MHNICMHGVLCFILINLICNMSTFKNEKQCLPFAPAQGVKMFFVIFFLFFFLFLFLFLFLFFLGGGG